MTQNKNYNKVTANEGDIDLTELGVLNNDVVLSPEQSDNVQQSYDRPLMDGSEDQTLYCSPNGTDDAEGTQDDPLTLLGALHTVPYFVHSYWTIDLHTVPSNNGNLPATYDDGLDGYRWTARGASGYGQIEILGDDANPSDIIVKNTLQAAWFGKGDHLRMSGIQFDNGIQANGFTKWDDCNIYQKNETNFLDIIIGSKKGQHYFNSCTIGQGNVPKALNVTDSGTYVFVGCDIQNDETREPMDIGRGSVLAMASATSSTYDAGGGSQPGVGNMNTSELVGVASGDSSMMVDPSGRIVTFGNDKYVHEATNNATGGIRQANIPLTQIADGDTAVGLRKLVPVGKELRILEVGVRDDTGNTPAGLDIEVYDDSNTTDVYSDNTAHAEGEVLASKSGAFDAIFRVANNTGGTVTASGYVLYTME